MMFRSPFSSRCLNLSGPANEYGAEAPATPRATAPAPTFLISSRRSRRRSAIPPPFSTKCAAGETGDEPIEERVVDQCQRDARDQDRGHDPGPVEEIAANQVGRNADRDCPVRRARDERDRIDELVDDE